MWPFLGALAGAALPGLVQGGLNLVGQREANQTNTDLARSTNEFNANQAAISRNFNSEEARKAREFEASQTSAQMAFQERMSSTAMQRHVADMRRAGINPLMGLGGGGASSPSGASAGGSGASGPAASGVSTQVQALQYGAMISTAADLLQKKVSIDKTIKEGEYIDAQTGEVGQRTKTYPATISKVEAETALTRAQRNEQEARSRVWGYANKLGDKVEEFFQDTAKKPKDKKPFVMPEFFKPQP